ncbi:hypothetical protein J0818_30360 [Bacillus cereus]|uniref:hypothetical protein n=1 Tax=Bacillus cereus TaxID=1396 RepID=UPI002FDC0D2A
MNREKRKIQLEWIIQSYKEESARLEGCEVKKIKDEYVLYHEDGDKLTLFIGPECLRYIDDFKDPEFLIDWKTENTWRWVRFVNGEFVLDPKYGKLNDHIDKEFIGLIMEEAPVLRVGKMLVGLDDENDDLFPSITEEQVEQFFSICKHINIFYSEEEFYFEFSETDELGEIAWYCGECKDYEFEDAVCRAMISKEELKKLHNNKSKNKRLFFEDIDFMFLNKGKEIMGYEYITPSQWQYGLFKDAMDVCIRRIMETKEFRAWKLKTLF